MEQLKWSTPIKNRNERENFICTSPIIYKTPVKKYETSSRHATYQNNTSCFSVLPNHITPPSGLTKFIARNPFETDLTSRLHLSVISPTVFNKASNSPQQSPDFAWSVDELALMQPAKIEEFPSQQIHCIDPETEIKAQAAIDQFFNGNEIIPSPWELKRKEIRTNIKVNTPITVCSDLNSESAKAKKDGWSQTVLTFPPELPSHVIEILKPYFTFTQEQNVESDDANSSNNSLRRKLFFNHEDFVENEEDSSVCLSPVKINGSLVLSSSPPQSGMLVHGAALKHSQDEGYNHETSQIISENLSPPNISPIQSTINNMSCESVRSRPRSVARLDFTTEMSIDQSSIQDKECLDNHSEDKSLNNVYHARIQADTCAEVKVLAKNSTEFEHNHETGTLEFNPEQVNVVNTFKYLTESCKINTNESYILQQTNTMLGISDQQSVSNSVQDTGYQTYSMSSTTNITDSYNTTPIKQKACWGDRILMTDEKFRLYDWKENMKNVFSSTPSRSNREKENHVP
ncbi:Protein aurora borealis [Habropoda laboriosa]|uniref:Protein aurora borealis n=1 Tax=Habropoda laboriosa TaxID=597456 RepID=A0A0L7QQP8_9HYME|nr:Protein aurora borealis [Habropoda laboriosa]